MGKVLFLYNNVDIPRMIIKYISDGVVSNIGVLSFDKTNLDGNLPILDQLTVALDDFLTKKNIERNEALFIINANDSVKLTTILPNIADRKVKKIYETELAQKVPNIDEYDCLSIISDTEENKIFYEYLVNRKYREFFEQIGSDLSFGSVEVDYMNSYLYSKVTPIIKKDTFAYICEENKMSYLLVVVNRELCGYSSFESKDSNYRLNVASIIDKHIYDLEKANINTLYTNKDIQCLGALNPILKKFVIGG